MTPINPALRYFGTLVLITLLMGGIAYAGASKSSSPHLIYGLFASLVVITWGWASLLYALQGWMAKSRVRLILVTICLSVFVLMATIVAALLNLLLFLPKNASH